MELPPHRRGPKTTAGRMRDEVDATGGTAGHGTAGHWTARHPTAGHRTTEPDSWTAGTGRPDDGPWTAEPDDRTPNGGCGRATDDMADSWHSRPLRRRRPTSGPTGGRPHPSGGRRHPHLTCSVTGRLGRAAATAVAGSGTEGAGRRRAPRPISRPTPWLPGSPRLSARPLPGVPRAASLMAVQCRGTTPPNEQVGSFPAGSYWAATGRTLVAWAPLGPWVMSNSTVCPSSSER